MDPRPHRRYAKPVTVPDRLDLLAGPTTGVVTLPRHLDWSGCPVYDLDFPGRIVDLYRTVILEATKPDDLHAYLNEATLRRLWPQLWLPAPVRTAWQSRFPDLPGPEQPPVAA
ncbi:MAG TPA: hypothetical protein VFM55_01210 [Micromonosporaceae bacterium]|nr:hypothetical protein [Micromonosporaceae bacterium]